MSGAVVGIVLLALLFVLFGLLRPADAGGGGCHSCGMGGSEDCGASCPLVKDLERTLNPSETQHERA